MVGALILTHDRVVCAAHYSSLDGVAIARGDCGRLLPQTVAASKKPGCRSSVISESAHPRQSARDARNRSSEIHPKMYARFARAAAAGRQIAAEPLGIKPYNRIVDVTFRKRRRASLNDGTHLDHRFILHDGQGFQRTAFDWANDR